METNFFEETPIDYERENQCSDKPLEWGYCESINGFTGNLPSFFNFLFCQNNPYSNMEQAFTLDQIRDAFLSIDCLKFNSSLEKWNAFKNLLVDSDVWH